MYWLDKLSCNSKRTGYLQATIFVFVDKNRLIRNTPLLLNNSYDFVSTIECPSEVILLL